MKRLAILILAVTFAAPLAAQKYPERRFVRSGNKLYERENYVESEVAYRRALEKTADCYEANDNLAKTLYKQKRYDEAAQLFASLAADSLHAPYAPAAWYDNGNALFQQRKLQEALESYKQSLRLNPSDMEAKFNLAYVQKLLENGGGGGGDDKDKDKDKKDQDKDQQNQPQKPKDDKGEPKPSDAKPSNPQQSNGNMSEQEAKHMLEAIQMNADKTREKMDEKKKAEQQQPKGGKRW